MQIATVCKKFVCEMYYVSIKSTECQCVMLYCPCMEKWSSGTVLRHWKPPWSKNTPNAWASAATDAKRRRSCLSWLTPSPGTVLANIATPWRTVAPPSDCRTSDTSCAVPRDRWPASTDDSPVPSVSPGGSHVNSAFPPSCCLCVAARVSKSKNSEPNVMLKYVK